MRRQLNKYGISKMTTLKDFQKEVFIINEQGNIESMTYGEYCREYGGDETTSPNGVAPRIHIRYDGRTGYNADAETFDVWTWGVSGNNPCKLESFDNEQDAEQSLYEHYEYHAINRNDNAPSLYDNRQEAIDTIVERIAEAEGITIEEAMDIYLDGINSDRREKMDAVKLKAKINRRKKKRI